MRKVLAKKLVEKLDGITAREAEGIIGSVFESIKEALLEGHKVNITNVISLELQYVEASSMYSYLLKKQLDRPPHWKLRKETTQRFKDKLKLKPVFGN